MEMEWPWRSQPQDGLAHRIFSIGVSPSSGGLDCRASCCCPEGRLRRVQHTHGIHRTKKLIIKMKMKYYFATMLLLLVLPQAQARSIAFWPYQKLVDSSDLVAIVEV